MNRGTMRQHPFLMRIAALVMAAVLLIFTIGTQVSYADGDSETGNGGGSVDHQGTKPGAGVEI